MAGRVDTGTFQRELHRADGLIGSAYDPNVTALDPNPTSAGSLYSDPVLDDTRAPITTAMTDLYQHVLNWRVDKPYELLEPRGRPNAVELGAMGGVPPQVFDDLRADLAADPLLRVLVAHGANDLVTPYFANQLLLDQLPVFTDRPTACELAVYAGGHMFHNRDGLAPWAATRGCGRHGPRRDGAREGRIENPEAGPGSAAGALVLAAQREPLLLGGRERRGRIGALLREGGGARRIACVERWDRRVRSVDLADAALPSLLIWVSIAVMCGA